MVHQSDDRILTTHIGSLPRPAELLALLKQRQEGESVDASEWEATVADAVETVVRRQQETGLDIINNGEQPRVAFNWYVEDRLRGIEGREQAPMWDDLADFPEYAKKSFNTDVLDVYTQPAVTGPLEYVGTSSVQFEMETFFDALAQTETDGQDTFFTAASPGIVAISLENNYYDTHEDFLFAIADAMQEEYEHLADSGAVLQLDVPELLAGAHRNFSDRTTEEFKEIVRLHIDALNDATSSIPSDQLRIHVCWGSYEGPHHEDIALDEILPELYEANVEGICIEQANPRHQHEYRAFEKHPVPDDWTVVPGVIDVKTNVIEHPEVVADRIERVADAVSDPAQIVAAPDCGFGTQAGLQMVDPEIAWAKLEALVEGARLASDRLF